MKTHKDIEDAFMNGTLGPAKTPAQKRTIVHLGNVGDFRLASKTRKYAKRFKDFEFVGIDINKTIAVKNKWKQIQANFSEGLKKMKDNSVHLISSEMALGYYGARGEGNIATSTDRVIIHTAQTLNIAHKKLVEGGKINITIDEHNLQSLLDAFKESPFKKNKIEITQLSKRESSKTFWTWFYTHFTVGPKLRHYFNIASQNKLYQVTAVK